MGGALLVVWAMAAAQLPDTTAAARLGAALARIHDSLTVLEGAAAQFQVDLVHASPDLVIARATRLRQHCDGTRHEVDQLDSLPGRGARLAREITALRAELVRCDREFATGPWYRGADSVKAWAPFRLARLSTAVRRFRVAARALKGDGSSR